MFLTVNEVAERVKTTPETIRIWIRKGLLPGYKIGKGLRVREDELDAFVRALRVGGAS
jgi:excisionase family DNA binding protein